MEQNLFRYVWRNSRGDQLVILGLVLLAQVFYFASLNIPKTIVNDGIEGKAFKTAQSVSFLRIELPVPSFLSDAGSIRLFDGFSLAQWPYLVAMSCLFLVMVTINGLFKKTINTKKGRMGERMLRRLRYQLYDRILLFPMAHFRKVKQAELASMVNNEIEPLGGFIGDAYVQPAFLGGQALTALLFIMLQSVWLGLIVVSILAVQALVIPKLRKRVIALGKQRQITARQFSGRIAETVDGVQEVRTNATSNYERADISGRLARIFGIRFELFQRKFTVKFLNNLLAQTTPFLIFLIGGSAVLSGDMQVGSVVGVLLAYKDLPGPVKELIDWDQQRQDMRQKYEQVIEQFQPESMLLSELQAMPAGPAAALAGPIELASVAVAEEGGGKPLDGVTTRFALDRRVALVGPAGGGKEVLAQVLARLQPPSGGKLNVAARDFATIPDADIGARLAYVGQDVYLFPLSLRDNILYGLKRRPRLDVPVPAERLRAEAEAIRVGNPPFDHAADWVDYAAAGATGPADIDERIVEALRAVELEDDVYQFGLRGRIDPAARPAAVERLMRARVELRARLADPAIAALVEPFDRERYHRNMSVADNVLFGTPVGKVFDPESIADNPWMRDVLRDSGLTDDLTGIGVQIAETMVELFADLAPGHPFFDQFSFISSEDLPWFRGVLQRLAGTTLADLAPEERARLRSLPFRYIEARHRLGLVDEAMEARLLAARRAFAAGLPAGLAGAIEFYDADSYNAASTVQDNILFGRVVHGQAQGQQRVATLIGEVLDGLSLRAAVIEVGLDHNVGVAGKRLSAVQRQKAGLARALIKRPDLLVLNEATAVFDGATQQRVLEKVLAACAGRGVVWALGRAALADRFDEVAILREGRVAARGAPSEIANDPTYKELLAAG